MNFDLAKKTFLFLSVPPLFLIPVDGTFIFFNQPKTIKAEHVDLKKDETNRVSRDACLSAFQKSALFGGVAPGGSLPGLQASLAELTKDYRLKGVLLSQESEAIVEDAKTRKSIFVKAGSQLGDLTVKEIKEGVIVLSYLGEDARLEIK